MPKKTTHPFVTLFKLSDGRLAAEWEDVDTGARKRESLSKLGYRTKTQAESWAVSKSKELIEERRRASIGGKRGQVGTAWPKIEEAYLEHFSSEHGDIAAERTKRDWLRRWREFLKARHLHVGADLQRPHLLKFRASLAKDGLAESSRNRTIGAVKAMLTWARKANYIRLIGDDIADTLGLFRVPETQPTVLKRTELRRLLKALVEHDSERYIASRTDKAAYAIADAQPAGTARFQPLAPFTLLALLTGARPGEVLGLNWKDVDLEAGELRVWGSKTQRQRVIPLHDSPALVTLLSALKLRSAGTTYVCGDWQDKQRKLMPKDIHARQWQRLLELAELRKVVKGKVIVQGPPMKALRSTCVAHVASASTDSEYLLEARFGHGANVSKKHYRKPLHGLSERGTTVEQWLGIETELQAVMLSLGLAITPPAKHVKVEGGARN